MRWRIGTALLGVLLLVSTRHASGATIAKVGPHLDIGDGLRTTVVAKPFDADGDNVYGTAGYEFFGALGSGSGTAGGFETNAITSLPAWVSDIASATGGFTGAAWGYAYAYVDDPRLAPGPSVADVMAGLAYRGSTTNGTEYALLRIVLSSIGPVPDSFRVGILLDSEGTTSNQFPKALHLSDGTVSDSHDSSGYGTARKNNDMWFFDVQGAAPGAQLTLYGTAQANVWNQIALAGLTFDVPVPEPSLAAMLAVALAAAVRRGRCAGTWEIGRAA